MWEYETRLGTFWLCIDQPGVCELWFEDKQIGYYAGIEEATEAVACFLASEEELTRAPETFSLHGNWETYDEFDEEDL